MLRHIRWKRGCFRIRLAVTPEITDPLPHDLAEIFGPLVSPLNETIPPRHLNRNLLAATWTLRAFGQATEKWRSEPRSDRCIGEIVSHFR